MTFITIARLTLNYLLIPSYVLVQQQSLADRRTGKVLNIVFEAGLQQILICIYSRG